VGGSISYFVSWRCVFFTYGALSLISTLLLLFAGRSAPSKKNPKRQFVKPYLDLLRNSKSLFVYCVILAEGILVIGSFSYLGAYTEHLFHYNYFVIGLVLTAFGAGAVVTGRLSGRIALKIGRSNTLSLGLILAVLADILLSRLSGSPVGLILGVGLLGGFMLAHSSLLTIATEFAKAARGTAMSLVAFCFMGGGGVGTAIGGKIIGSAGYAYFYLLFGIFLAGLVGIARITVSETKP
jgi:predicted MFS family arabinose efflux permease